MWIMKKWNHRFYKIDWIPNVFFGFYNLSFTYQICTSIQVLDLSDCIVKEDTIDFICTNEHYVNNLRVLDLSSTNLNPAAICRIIQSLDRLERLYLSGTNLTDEAFETLYINTAVRPLLAAKSASSPSSPSHGTKRKREETEDIEDIIDYYQYDDPYPSRRDPSRDVLDADQCSSLCGPLSSFVKNLAQGRSSSRYRPPQSPCDVCSVAFCEGAPRKFPNLSKLVVSGCERLTSKGKFKFNFGNVLRWKLNLDWSWSYTYRVTERDLSDLPLTFCFI